MQDKETRQYVIPLRRAFLLTPRWRRTEKAVSTVRKFLARHTKADKIKLGRWLNEELWAHGLKNPPSRIKINVTTSKEKIKGKKEKEIEILVANAELAVLPGKAKRFEEKSKKVRDAVKKIADKDKSMLDKAKEGLKKGKEEEKTEEEKKEEKQHSKMSKKEEMAQQK